MHKPEATKVVQPTGHKELLASKAMNWVPIFTGVDEDAARGGIG